MKTGEIPTYRAFMLAVVPQLLLATRAAGAADYTLEKAIADAEALWLAVDAHIDRVVLDLEQKGY